ncbi:MAG: endo-1,4-beta-xylanase [Planctomycetes bacterium]|nr:endo-1,4-beta-xylanase [Planctomycetota bacterium]
MTWKVYSQQGERNGVMADLQLDAFQRRRFRVLIFLLASACAILQITLSGYDIGVGNQTIQIPYLKHLLNPQLYTQDPAIVDTIDAYPSSAYKMLAYFCVLCDYQFVYAFLHFICSFCVFAAVLYGSLTLFGEIWSGILASFLLIIGIQHGLAGADVYSLGFSHTWFSIPCMLWVFIAQWRKNYVTAGVILGLLFNIHALHAVYTAVFVVAIVSSMHEPRHWWRMGYIVCPAVLCALPALVNICSHSAAVDAQWFDLMFIRSAHHSFPLSLWSEGDSSITRFCQIILCAALLSPCIRDPFHRRMAQRILITFIVLLLLGIFGTGSASIVKLQLWRSSGILLLLMCMCIGHCLYNAYLLKDKLMRLWVILVVVVCGCLMIPSFHGFVYPLLALLTIYSLCSGIVSTQAAILIASAHAIIILSFFFLSTPLWSWPPDIHLNNILENLTCILSASIALALALWMLTWNEYRMYYVCAGFALMCTVGGTVAIVLSMCQREESPWTDVQNWARNNTAIDARFACSINRSGFRIDSERAVVGEWRDGTQMYFSHNFSVPWWQRMQSLQTGLDYDSELRRLDKRGRTLSFANDHELLDIAEKQDVDYFVLPRSRQGNLVSVYQNQFWQICRAQLPAPGKVPEYAKEDEIWQAQQEFIRDVVEPNIIKHRSCNLQIQFVDITGKPLADIAYRLHLKKHEFGFGSGLPFFRPKKTQQKKGFVPSIVKDTDLEYFPQVFNWSTVPYSAKWMYIEPEEGVPYYDDLDAYVDWCVEHDIDIEYHFVTGYQPAWMKKKKKEGRQAALIKHTNEIIDRYGEKIHHYQVVNEKKLLHESVAAFKVFRERLPDAQLGISDCARFYTKHHEDEEKRNNDLLRGLKEVLWLRKQGVELDFFAFHGHRPFGLWADVRVLYETLDKFQDEGLRIHISEFGIHESHKILGDVRTGSWNKDLQAEYYAMIYKACFSHPVVDVINMWGFSSRTWMGGSGLMDKDGNPKPSFYALKKLIREELHTHAEGVLPVHGRMHTQAFHGDYELTIELENGPLEIPLQVMKNASFKFKITIDLVAGSCASVQQLE